MLYYLYRFFYIQNTQAKMIDIKIGNYNIKKDKKQTQITNQHQGWGLAISNKKLGQGSFGLVRLGFYYLLDNKVTPNFDNPKNVAIKIVDQVPENDKHSQIDLNKYIESQTQILKEVNHPNIIKLIKCFKIQTQVYYVTEIYQNGSLKSQLNHRRDIKKQHPQKNINFDQNQIFGIYSSIVNALYYLYMQKRVVHRDIKPENILLTQDLNSAVICDLGIAKILKLLTLTMKTILGTLKYMCPQIINKKKKYNQRCDSWSLGAVLYQLLFPNQHLITKRQRSDIAYQQRRVENKINLIKWENHNYKHIEFWKEQLQNLLKYSPKERWGIQDIRQSLQKYKEQKQLQFRVQPYFQTKQNKDLENDDDQNDNKSEQSQKSKFADIDNINDIKPEQQILIPKIRQENQGSQAIGKSYKKIELNFKKIKVQKQQITNQRRELYLRFNLIILEKLKSIKQQIVFKCLYQLLVVYLVKEIFSEIYYSNGTVYFSQIINALSKIREQLFICQLGLIQDLGKYEILKDFKQFFNSTKLTMFSQLNFNYENPEKIRQNLHNFIIKSVQYFECEQQLQILQPYLWTAALKDFLKFEQIQKIKNINELQKEQKENQLKNLIYLSKKVKQEKQ